MDRRSFLATLAASAAAASVDAQPADRARKGRIKQALMRFAFGPAPTLTFDDMCREAARLGYVGFDLTGPPDWPTLAKHGLICTMAPAMGVTIRDGLIRPELHQAIERSMHEEIDLCAARKFPNIITVGGERRGIGYEEGKEHCAALLNRVKSHAEDKGITICIEVVNSKYKDPEYGRADAIFDRLAWGADVCRRVNSPRVKMLFDIYHVQIMEGDVCANIREYFPLIAHFHTAGVPGRHEIDETQELNYRFVAQTIADLGFSGYVAHEYRPTPGRDPLESLRRTVEIMDV
ncbi:MAG: hydroxypyruvate isomerase [Acidobacteria bacterium]|nr:MAG: hydroxypyruvate isomerase [Acidobacteriota bacterium]